MPDRLYRDDSYLRTFAARVTGATPGRPGVFSVELDRTAFYPTGGGQPNDTGSLGGLDVIDVREADAGRILHDVRCEAAPSGTIEGVIDWRRRFDHMQQHSGQHILSRSFIEVADAPTVSFHMGESACTIDVRLADPSEEVIRAAEARANAIVFSDVPVGVRSVPPDRAPRLEQDLQRDLALKPGDPVRIISIGDYDETPCGGTHVSRSGEVGLIAIRGWERFKGGTRVIFACGGRAARMHAELSATVDACVERLSAPPPELPSAIDRLLDQMGEARREVKRLGEALAAAEAEGRLARARAIGGCRIVLAVIDDRGSEEIARLARSCAAAPGAVALLAGGSGSGKTALVFARSEEGAAATLHMGDLLAAVCGPRGGKGGGGPTLARGGGLPAERLEEALEEACSLIAERLAAPR